MNKERGLLLVISGPSGAGKGTVCRAYIDKCKKVWNSVSVTTRKPRQGEVEGESYFFISEEEFKRKIKENELLEYAEVYGNFYGTPRKEVEEKLKQGIDVILEIDIQGALNIKKNTEDGVFIFILPPSMEELKNRIVGRKSETKESLIERFTSAYKEISYVSSYHYVIINNTVEEAYKDLSSIVRAEKLKVSRVNNTILASLREENLNEFTN